MADTKVSDLVEVTVIDDADSMYVATPSGSRQISGANLKTATKGSKVIEWDFTTDVVINPPVMINPEPGDISLPNAAATVITASTITNDSIGDGIPSYSFAKISDTSNFGGPKWLLGRVNYVTGTYSPGTDIIGVGMVNGTLTDGYFVMYSPVTNEIQVRTLSTVIHAVPMGTNEWFMIYIDNTTQTIGFRLQDETVYTTVTATDFSSYPVYATIVGRTSSGTGTAQFEISVDEANLGTIDPVGATPLGIPSTVLPSSAVVGDHLLVTAGGVYSGDKYEIGDVVFYADDAPETLSVTKANNPVADSNVLIRVPEDFANLNLALDEAKKYSPVAGAKVTIEITTGHTLTEDDVLEVYSLHIPHVYISTVYCEVNFSSSPYALFHFANVTFGGITGRFELTTGTVTGRLLNLYSCKFTTGIGDPFSNVEAINFQHGCYLVDVTATYVKLVDTAAPAYEGNDLSLSGNKVGVSSIETNRNLGLGSTITNEAITSTRTEGTLYITHGFPGSGSWHVYFSNEGSIDPDNFKLAVVGNSSSVSTDFGVRFLKDFSATAPILGRVDVNSDNMTLDFFGTDFKWAANNVAELVSFSKRGGTLNLIDMRATDVHPSMALVPQCIFRLSPGCRVIAPGFDSAVKGTHYTRSLGMFTTSETYKYRLPKNVEYSGSVINTLGDYSTLTENNYVIVNSNTTITDSHAGKTLLVDTTSGIITITFDISASSNNSAFLPYRVKVIKTSADAGAVIFSGTLNPSSLVNQYDSVEFEVYFNNSAYGEWIGKYGQ